MLCHPIHPKINPKDFVLFPQMKGKNLAKITEVITKTMEPL